MKNLDGWICMVKGVPDALVRVNWHKDGNCGCSIIEPPDELGGLKVFSESILIPQRRVRKIRSKDPLNFSDDSVEALKERLSKMRTMRASDLVDPKARKTRGKRKASVSKGGLLGLIGKLSPEGLVALDLAMKAGKENEEIMQLIKDDLGA